MAGKTNSIKIEICCLTDGKVKFENWNCHNLWQNSKLTIQNMEIHNHKCPKFCIYAYVKFAPAVNGANASVNNCAK